MKKIISLFLISTLFFSCSNAKKEKSSNPFNALAIKETLKKGKTTKAEVLSKFGGPHVISDNSDQTSVWTYSMNRTESGGGSIGMDLWGLIPAPLALIGLNGEVNKDSKQTKSITLNLTFKNNLLEDYNFIRTSI